MPPPINAFIERGFKHGAREAFDGEVTVGADGMRFALAPR